MLWLHNKHEYALVRFSNTEKSIYWRAYEYKLYNTISHKELIGKGIVHEGKIVNKKFKKHSTKNKIKFGKFNILWSATGSIENFYIYVVPSKFDIRILSASDFSRYRYFPNYEQNIKTQRKKHKYSCYQCYSICGSKLELSSLKNKVPQNFFFKGKNYNNCIHIWQEIQSGSLGHPEPISDGTIILVKKGDIYGAFKLYDQKSSPESASFKWWYRKDGKGKFIDEAKAKRGDSKTQLKSGKSYTINFGPFNIAWSIASTGKGYVYYNFKQKEKISQNALSICITKKKNINNIDATDKKWKYRTRGFY